MTTAVLELGGTNVVEFFQLWFIEPNVRVPIRLIWDLVKEDWLAPKAIEIL